MSDSPDWIGFDLDHTLIRYKLEALRSLTHVACVEFLKQHSALPADAFAHAPVRALEVRGAVIDRRLGNVIFVDERRRVYACHHGATATSTSTSDYDSDADLAAFQFTTTPRFWPTHSYFETFLPGLFARLVDWLDTANATAGYWAAHPRCDVRSYEDVTDAVHQSLIYLYTSYDRGLFFKEFRERTENYVYLRPFVARWIERVRARSPHTRVFLVTNSMVQFTDLLCRYALGVGAAWPELFDLVVFKARKPLFFSHGCSKSSLDPLVCYAARLEPPEVASTPLQHMQVRGADPANKYAHLFEGGCAAQADALFRRVSGKERVNVWYAGDHLVGDCRAAAHWSGAWNAVAVVEELFPLEQALREPLALRCHLVDDAHPLVEFDDDVEVDDEQLARDRLYDAERHAQHGAYFFTPDGAHLTFQGAILQNDCKLVVSDVHALMSVRNGDPLHMFRSPKSKARFQSQGGRK